MSTVSLLPEVEAFIGREHGLFIDGVATPATTTGRISITNPADGRTFASIADASDEDVDKAVQSSCRAFKGVWARTSPQNARIFCCDLPISLASTERNLRRLRPFSRANSSRYPAV